MDSNKIKRLITLTQAGCQDKTVQSGADFYVHDGQFVFRLVAKRGVNENILALVQAMGVPADAEQHKKLNADGSVELEFLWPSHADAIFGKGGLLDANLPNYEMRIQQLYMARSIQRSMEMGQNCIVEAPTGTGKSFAYVAIALAMGKKVLVSTSNKALQAQLYHRDVPFLAQLLNPDAQITLAQGKGNYLCLHKMFDELSGKPLFQHDELLAWAKGPHCTGNLEDVTFGVDDDTRHAVNVDQTCLGKKCGRFHQCYYFEQRRRRSEADVLICNHALLVINELYPMANLLPDMDVVVVDEAHQLTAYARNALGDQFQVGRIKERVRKIGQTFDLQPEAHEALDAFLSYVAELRKLVQPDTMEALTLAEEELESYAEIRTAFSNFAKRIWNEEDEPEDGDDMKRVRAAQQVRNMRDSLRRLAKYSEGDIRWLDLDKPGAINDDTKCNVAPNDVSWLIGKIAGFVEGEGAERPFDAHNCNRCNRQHGATVHKLWGYGLCADCNAVMDVEGIAEVVTTEEWVEAWQHFQGEDHKQHSDRPPVVFTSATLASPGFSTVKREWGVKYAIELIVDSPFDYAKNAAVYVPAADQPNPRDKDRDAYFQWLTNEMRRLVAASNGGAFLLFTSYYAMNRVAEQLRPLFESRNLPTFVQGELPKVEMVRRFKEAQDGVLFGTRSFFEGVDVQGLALRLVALDKLPFEPITPLRQAEDEWLVRWAADNVTNRKGKPLSAGELERYPFNEITIPRMIVELKQAMGRLIRTQDDIGIFAVLDTSLRTKYYGRARVFPALPDTADFYTIEQVASWFEKRLYRQAA